MQNEKRVDLADAFHDEIDDLVRCISETHNTEDIQNDIVALFEDIIKYFSGREEEFISLKDMPEKDQREIYHEIMAIINILRDVKKVDDKKEIIAILSRRLTEKFAKNKKLIKEKEAIREEEAKQIKELFTRVTLHQMHLLSNRLYEKMAAPKLSTLKRQLNRFTNRQNNRMKESGSFEEKEILSRLKSKAASRKI